MQSKGYSRFKTRLIYFRNDVELVDIIVMNKEALKGENSIFRKLEPNKHKSLSSRKNSPKSRKLLMAHLRKTTCVAFLKEMYEEVTEYFQYILVRGSKSSNNQCRIVGEHQFSMPANEVLQLALKGRIVETVVRDVFRSLEKERSTLNLLQKTQNKLGLKISKKLIDEALPYLECRHIFVHRDGKPDEKFLTAYPDIKLDGKGRILLDMDFLNKAYAKVEALITAYDQEMINKGYIPDSEFA